MTTIGRIADASLPVLLVLHVAGAHATVGLFHKTPKKTTAELRAEYLANVSQSVLDSSSRRTSGSLWSADALMVEPAADYKAHALNDIVTVVVSVQTTAAQSGSVDSERNFQYKFCDHGYGGRALYQRYESIACRIVLDNAKGFRQHKLEHSLFHQPDRTSHRGVTQW